MQNINKTGLVDEALSYLKANSATGYRKLGQVLYTAEIKQDVKTLKGVNYAYLSSGAVHFVTLIVSDTEVRNGVILLHNATGGYCFVGIDSNGYRAWDMGTVASATATAKFIDTGETGSVNDLKEHYSRLAYAPVGGGSAVSNVAFNNAKPTLTTLRIVDKEGNETAYKTVPCGNSSGGNSVAIGYGSVANRGAATASGPNSTASGPNSTATGYYSTAIGYGSVASGGYSNASGANSIAIGYLSTATESRSIAIGYEAQANIPSWVSFDGNNPANTDPQNNYPAFFSPDYVLFRNADVDYNATATSAYPDLKTLTDYLGAGAPTIVTETSANILAGTSPYFNVTGSGTSGDPYIVTPKTTLAQPHAHRVYQITMSTPTANTYIHFKGSGTETCMVEITSNNAAASFSYLMNFYDLYSHVRPRDRLNAGTLVSTDIDSKTSNAEIYIDLNGYGMYTTNAI